MLGVYPAVTLAKARKRREDARTLLADGIDPRQAKRANKAAKADAATYTFEAVGRTWLAKTSADRSKRTQEKVTAALENAAFPYLGKMPISTSKPLDVLATIRKMEASAAIDSAHRLKQLIGQVFRYATAGGHAERDVTVDLKGALAAVPKPNDAALTEPTQVSALFRSIYDYKGQAAAVAALKLAPMVFVRPGELRSMEWGELDVQLHRPQALFI